MIPKYCRVLDIRATKGELRDLAAAIHALSSDNPVAGLSRRATDLTYPDSLGDMLLYPADRAYSVP
jgi:hypothetical protein